jgi:hypothetical protein
MVLGVDAYLIDWLNLVFRWFHVMAAIVWTQRGGTHGSPASPLLRMQVHSCSP